MKDNEAMIAKHLDSIDLTNWKHQLGTIPMIWLVLIAGSVFASKDVLTDAVGMVNHDDFQELEQKVDTHLLEYRMDFAMRQVEAAESALAAHNQEALDTPSWQATRRDLIRKVQLAHDLKTCVLSSIQKRADNNGPLPDCSLIQRQLWQ